MTLHNTDLPTIAVTMGDPAGIGPEVVVKALADPDIAAQARWIVAGDARVVRSAETVTGLRLPPEGIAEVLDPNEPQPAEFTVGRVSADAGRAALSYIRTATQLCLEGRAAAMATAPVNKEAVTLAGEEFTGHTEYIAALCGAADSRMLLVNDRLRVVHVSTHTPLRQACELDTGRILRTIELGQEAMRW